jgi:hypothetical protein
MWRIHYNLSTSESGTTAVKCAGNKPISADAMGADVSTSRPRHGDIGSAVDEACPSRVGRPHHRRFGRSTVAAGALT